MPHKTTDAQIKKNCDRGTKLESKSLFAGKNKENMSKCLLLKFLPSILSIKILNASVLAGRIVIKACYNSKEGNYLSLNISFVVSY